MVFTDLFIDLPLHCSFASVSAYHITDDGCFEFPMGNSYLEAVGNVFAKVGPDMFANNSPASVLDTGKSTEILFTRPVQYFCINNGEVDAEVSADLVQRSGRSMAVHGATYVLRARAGKRAAVPTTP